MKEITKNDLSGLVWRDISIQKLQTGETVLILVCETEDQSNKLMDVIKSYAFSLKVLIKKPSNNYLISLEFGKSDYGIMYDTERNDVDYPPLKWLKENKVTKITTGIWVNTNENGNHVYGFRQDVFPLNKVELN